MSDEKKDTSGVTVTDSSILLTVLPPWSRNRPDGLVDSVKASATSTLVANLISESRRLIAVQADVESEPDVAVVDTVVPMEERDVLGDGRPADSGPPNLETFGNALGRYEQMGPLGAGGGPRIADLS